MKTELKQNCYLLARYDVDKNLELSQGCSTRQVSLKQHECETQVRLVSAVTWSSLRIADQQEREGDRLLLQLQLLQCRRYKHTIQIHSSKQLVQIHNNE